MLQNYLKLALRILAKNKVYSFINIGGLAIGIAACLAMLVFVAHERSFDDFHSKNLYRLNEVQKFEGMVASQKVALSMYPMGPTLKNEFPEVKNFVRIRSNPNMPMEYKTNRVFLDQVFVADSSFFQMFDFPLVKGDRASALRAPKSVILTEESARKFFRDEDPIGKTILYFGRDTMPLQVTGVLKNIPKNSHLQFDAVVPFHAVARPDWMNNWGSNWLRTYLELAPGADMAALERKFPDYLKKYMTEDEGWKFYELFLLPMRDVHAKSTDIGLDDLNYRKFDQSTTNVFFLMAIVILLIACVNFVNLSTARSSERAKEVGIRKSIGAGRPQLTLQFMGESTLLSFFAMMLAVAAVKIALPFIGRFAERELSFPIFTNWKIALALLTGTALLGILSGLYPAAYLSSFMPVKVLKNALHSGKNKRFMRDSLVVGQFACAIFLMLATGLATKQLFFMKNQDPGFEREQVVNISLNRVQAPQYEVFKKTLLANTLITGVTAAQDVLGSHLDQSGVGFRGDGPLRELTGTRLIVDPDYLSVYKIPLIAGRDFSQDKNAEGREYIINEQMAKELLKDSPGAALTSLLDKQFGFDSTGQIIGIAKDFNFNSLHNKIETLFLCAFSNFGYSDMSVKIAGNNTKESLAFLETEWQKHFPDLPFKYEFLDDHFEEVYRADAQVGVIVGILAGLAIFISCLGLFGLATYTTERRTKEIGVRKVLGASVSSVTGLLAKDFLQLVALAFVIASPIAYYFMQRWLSDFAYHIDIQWWMFAAAGAAAVGIAFLTVGFQSVKAALANPVKSLRSE
jgi:putative ABC transport system permease protein